MAKAEFLKISPSAPPLSRAGFTLVEAVVAIATSSVLLLAVGSWIRQAAEQNKMSTIISTRNSLFRQLGLMIRKNTALKNTATNNPAFANCYTGNTATPCTTMASAAGLDLYDNTSTSGPSPGVPKKIAGSTAGTPVYYDMNGVLCAPPVSGWGTCILQATATFTASCGYGAVGNCAQAQSIRVAFKIDLIPGLSGGSAALTSLATVSGYHDWLNSGAGTTVGSGTTGNIAIWTSASKLGNSSIIQSLPGTAISIGTAVSPANLTVTGNTAISGDYVNTGATSMAGTTGGNDLINGQILVSNATTIGGFAAASNVLVQKTTPTTGQLTARVVLNLGNVNVVSGGVYAPAFITTSDQALKTDIHPIEDVRARIEKLKGVSFRWKESARRDLGLIAQEVQEIFPELVSKNPNGYLSVEYSNLVAPLLEAYKDEKKSETKRAQGMDEELASIERNLSRHEQGAAASEAKKAGSGGAP